ncbi:hypothetical protein [Streptomyces sp. 8N706]|uniref:hypothetical protein n=1 Tax=Streptomyces sp. 8N706 TaxID=3457416 RepID=UPI003FD559AA
MTDLLTEKANESEPAFWYGIPYGYMTLDLDPPLERIEALVEEVLRFPEGLRDLGEQVLRFYTGVITSLNAQNVQGCAVGLHPDEEGGVSLSTLTVSTVPASGVSAKLVLAAMVGTAADNLDEAMRPLELPCGTGFVAEKKRRTVAPGRPPEGSDTPPEGTIWQGTVAVTGSGTRDIVVIQLVTSAVDLADDYRNVLLGVAHTLTFTDPSVLEAEGDPAGAEANVPADASRSPFG